METIDWSLVRCGNCRRALRLPHLEEVAYCECPKCRAILEVPADWVSRPTEASLRLFELEPVRGSASDGTASEAEAGGATHLNLRRRAADPDGFEDDYEEDDLAGVEEEDANRRTVLAVGTVLALLTVGVFVGTLSWSPGSRARPEPERLPFPSRVVPPRHAGAQSGTSIDLATDYPGAVSVVRRFLGAPTVNDLWAHVRDPARVRPLALDYYRTHSYQPAAIRTIGQRIDVETSGRFLFLPVEFDDLTSTVMAVEKSPDGFKVDWESHVAHSAMDWVDFTVERPTEPVFFRVVLGRDNYFNYAFTDESKWECWSVQDQRGDTVGYAYAPRNSPLATEIIQCLKGRESARLMLELRFPEQSPVHNQVEIVSFVGCGWIRQPGDEVEDAADRPIAPER